MTTARLLLVVLLGLVLRGAACAAHDDPRGDVVLDVAVARSLAAGDGFAAGYVRGQPKLVGDGAVPVQDRADQHPPLWPLVGATLSFVAGDAFAGLRWGSMLFGLLVLLLVGRLTDRLTEHVPGVPGELPALAMALAALSFVLVDAAGNGSLYGAQAALVLLLVEALAAARPSPPAAGLVLGALLLLNHQCAVLLPVPPLALLVAARPGARREALLRGVGITLVGLLLLVPWWIRNALVFDDPFHSVNATYFLYRAGVEPDVSMLDGTLVFRFAQELSPRLMARACLAFLKPNALYVLTAGLAVWPGLLGVLAAGFVPLGLRGVRTHDRRLVALILCAAALGAVAVLWPATKLRYLVTLAPLGIVLGARLLVEPRLPGERVAVGSVLLVWIAALAATFGDVTGAEADPRPGRWWVLAVGGAALLVLPLLLWTRRRPSSGAGLLLHTGLPVAAALALAVPLGPGPGTAYHAAPFLPDFFGRPAETEDEADALALRLARDVALADGARLVAGPVELAAFARPAVWEITRGLPEPLLREVLAGVVARGTADHVILLASDAPWLASDPGALPGLRLVPTGDDHPSALVFEVVR